MKKLILFSFSILFAGTIFPDKKKTFLDISFRKDYVKNHTELKEEWKEFILKGEIPLGMEKEEVEKILGKNYEKYTSKTGLMEVWIYEKYYVGFDKNGKVIKFGIFDKNKGEK